MRFFILLITAITVLAVVSLFLIADLTVPQSVKGQLILINLVYFFLALFVSLAGIASLVLYSVSTLRLKAKRKGSTEAVIRPRTILKRSVLQGLVFSACLTTLILLRALGFANPLNVILVISAGVLIEIYFFGH